MITSWPDGLQTRVISSTSRCRVWHHGDDVECRYEVEVIGRERGVHPVHLNQLDVRVAKRVALALCVIEHLPR